MGAIMAMKLKEVTILPKVKYNEVRRRRIQREREMYLKEAKLEHQLEKDDQKIAMASIRTLDQQLEGELAANEHDQLDSLVKTMLIKP